MEEGSERYFVFEPDMPLIVGAVQPRDVDPRLAPALRGHIAFRIDPYIGCAFDCSYCIIKDFMRVLGWSWGLPAWWLEDLDQNWRRPIVRPRFIERLQAELEAIDLPLVRLGTYSDPYQPVEKDLRLTRQILGLLLWKAPRTNVVVWTKGTQLPRRDFDLFLGAGDRFRLTVSIDDDPARSPINEARIRLVEEARAHGITAGIAFDPWRPLLDPVKVIQELDVLPAYCIIGGLFDLGGNFLHLDHYQRELPRVLRCMLDHSIPHELELVLERAVGLDGYSEGLLSPRAICEWLEEHGEEQ